MSEQCKSCMTVNYIRGDYDSFKCWNCDEINCLGQTNESESVIDGQQCLELEE